VVIYPSNGYGSPDQVRQMIKVLKDQMRFLSLLILGTGLGCFKWKSEIRRKIPIIYLNIWDDYPAPRYNEAYYESCDLLMGISKQTVNINKLVLGDKAKDKLIKYVPHGLNHEIFRPLDKDDSNYGRI
jgi:hypothetical protein